MAISPVRGFLSSFSFKKGGGRGLEGRGLAGERAAPTPAIEDVTPCTCGTGTIPGHLICSYVSQSK